MKAEKIKPVPKYIVERIKRYDKENLTCAPGHTRFYSYLTKNDGELVKVTVAVRNHYKQWLYKQVAVHGLNSKECFVKDMVFYYIAGYQVGWYEQGLQKSERWYESTDWGCSDDKYFDPFAPIVNREYLDKFPEYKYSAVNLYRGVDILKYLRYYKQYPQIEYLMKAGLSDYAFSTQILKEIGKNRRFCKWLMKNRAEIMQNNYYVDVILRAFRTNKPVADLQAYKKYRMQLSKEAELKELRTFFKNDLEKFVLYIRSQNTNPYSYRDYLRACNYLGLNMSESKNRYPHDFKRWHDIRIDEYNTAKALKDEQERKALYDRFAAVASKYLGLEYDKKSVYIAIIAQKPSDLIHEGELLHHCVGRMGYDQKFAREESLIFFIRTKSQPDVPFVTIEYSPAQKRIVQCYGDHDSKPTEEVINFVHKKWLPYANRKLKQLAA